MLYSIIGTGLAGIALIPSFYAILGSGKATETIGTHIELMYCPQKILEHLKTLVAPIESGSYRAFYDSSIWSSTGVYLPIFGCTCVIQWCIQKKNWLKKICILLVVCYFVPVLNAMFNLFSSTTYTRWLYGMALIFSLVTAMTLEEMQIKKQRMNRKVLVGATFFTAGILLIPSIIYLLHYFGISIVNRFASACVSEYFMGYTSIIVMLILTLINYIVLWNVAGKRKLNVRFTIIAIIAICTLNFGVYNMVNYDLHATDYSNDDYYKKALVEGNERTNHCFEYRIDYPNQIVNYGLFKNMSAVNYYNSLQNPSSSRFAEAVGIGSDLQDTILLVPDEGAEYIDTLLSVKYYYDYDGNGKVPVGFHYLKSENGVDIYENENYISMGYTYDSYCTEKQLMDMLPENRAKIMLETLVVREEDEKIVNKYLSMKDDVTDTSALSDVVSDRKKLLCSNFEGTSKGFQAEITLDEDNIVFFSIPNDTGWDIRVNGDTANVVEVNYGLIGVCCQKGANTISATYHTKGCKLGIFCSVICLIVWIMLEGKQFLDGDRTKHGRVI